MYAQTQDPSDVWYFQSLLDRIRALPPRDAGDVFLDKIPKWIEAVGAPVTRRPLPGTPMLYWDGDQIVSVPYDPVHDWSVDYHSMALKILDAGAASVLDIGAGPCFLGIALRYVGFTGPITHLEIIPQALAIGRFLSSSLGLSGINYVAGDAKRLSDLRQASPPPGFTVSSRQSIHQFYARDEYVTLFNTLIQDLGAASGVHVDFGGHRTRTFERYVSSIPNRRPGRYEGLPGDFLAHLAERTDIAVTERIDILPHYPGAFAGNCPSYLSWIVRSQEATAKASPRSSSG